MCDMMISCLSSQALEPLLPVNKSTIVVKLVCHIFVVVSPSISVSVEKKGLIASSSTFLCVQLSKVDGEAQEQMKSTCQRSRHIRHQRCLEERQQHQAHHNDAPRTLVFFQPPYSTNRRHSFPHSLDTKSGRDKQVFRLSHLFSARVPIVVAPRTRDTSRVNASPSCGRQHDFD